VDELTRLLLADPPPVVTDAVRARLRSELVDRIRSRLCSWTPPRPAVITLAALRQVRTRPERLVSTDEPFVWRPAMVRRSLGLATLEACTRARFRSPLEAVRPVLEEAVDRWERTGWRTYYWEPWVAGLEAGARAVVLAEAAAYASSLWGSLAWPLLAPNVRFGGADDQWAVPLSAPVRLRGRSEFQVLLGPQSRAGDRRPPCEPVALVSVAGGAPEESWAPELAFLALVASLRSASRPVPARVAGVWPDAGAFRTVDIDEPLLRAAVDLVTDGLGAAAAAFPTSPGLPGSSAGSEPAGPRSGRTAEAGQHPRATRTSGRVRR
jgi:hypothetical protein